MKILLITLCVCAILSICKSRRLIENDSKDITSIIPNNAYDRRGLLIFPKHKKFIVSPIQKTNYNKEDLNFKDITGTRKPLMAKIVPKPNVYSFQTKIATRKPLMKVRTYTIKMNSKVEDINHSKINFSNIDNRAEKHFISKTIKLDKLNANKRRFSKEEEQDRSEFIFLEKSNKIVFNDLLNIKDDDFETTTEAIKLNIRQKRSSNIIVEENMEPTVSPLKYTGRDSRLTNELYFKNINH